MVIYSIFIILQYWYRYLKHLDLIILVYLRYSVWSRWPHTLNGHQFFLCLILNTCNSRNVPSTQTPLKTSHKCRFHLHAGARHRSLGEYSILVGFSQEANFSAFEFPFFAHTQTPIIVIFSHCIVHTYYSLAPLSSWFGVTLFVRIQALFLRDRTSTLARNTKRTGLPTNGGLFVCVSFISRVK